MTVATFGGPVAFGWVLSGGRSPAWPPDRPVEWWTLGGLSALVAALMAACIAVALRNRQDRPLQDGNPPTHRTTEPGAE
jgi:hypothetical protein